MDNSERPPSTAADRPTPGTPAARALEEAEKRKRLLKDNEAEPEISGRGGLDPVRYGDWEIKGLTSDF